MQTSFACGRCATKSTPGTPVAIYHLSVKTVSRSAGRSATAAAAYRAGVAIRDGRTGTIHDYTRKGGVESAELVLPTGAPEWAADREALWNAAEQAETRKNSTVAREFEIALPEELSSSERQRLACDLAREIVERHGCAADVAIHAPRTVTDRELKKNPELHHDTDPKTGRRHNGNWHAHILLTTRRLGPDGFTEKTRELDDKKTGSQLVTQWRERFAVLQNERLREMGKEARVDHRSLADQGVKARLPSKHVGPKVAAMERRLGKGSRRRAVLVTQERLYLVERRKEEAKVKAQLMEGVKAEDNLQRQAWRGHLAKRRGVWKEVGVSSLAAQARPGKPLLYRWKSGPAKGMAVMLDYGNRIKAAGRPEAISDTKIRMMISLAREKGWKTICIDGPADFRQRAAVAAARAGLGVQNQDLKAVVAAARMPVAPNRENVPVKATETPQDAPKEKSKADPWRPLKTRSKRRATFWTTV